MSSIQHVLLSPAELAYLHDSLSRNPPLRPDGRTSTQFRPLLAETGILPGTNGSARICFADGTEAIAGVKAEVERTCSAVSEEATWEDEEGADRDDGKTGARRRGRKGRSEWVDITVQIPGQIDDDAGTQLLAAMLSEALVADGQFAKKLWINRRFHWKLYLDILLISQPLSYPLPLLSLTTHLALLATRLPKLASEGDEDPFFDDDWAAATYLYPRNGPPDERGDKAATKNRADRIGARPPVTLLVMAVGDNVIFDPAKEELVVAEIILAVSVGEAEVTDRNSGGRHLRLLAVRTIDLPSRLTAPGVSNASNAAYGAAAATTTQRQPEARTAETEAVDGVWKAPRGGAKPRVMTSLVYQVLEKGGVAHDVLDGLDAVHLV